MIDYLALAVVILAAVFLIGLALASVFAPAKAATFLNGFAGSARVHYMEICIRLIAGAALIITAPRMHYANLFHLFGWVIVVTSLLLLLLPWRWHRRFAQVAVPPLTKRVWLFGLLSFPLGGFILFSVLNGGTA